MAYTNIDDPSAYFQNALYTGNGSSQSITNDGNSDMQPDWVWVKSRSIAYHNVVFDSSRGVNNRLVTNLTQAEDTGAGYGTVSAFNSDGFSVSSGANTNNNSATYVGWQWKANGGTTASNSNGSITSTVQANTTAGFSIVTYTGTGSAATVGHGLGVTPDMIIFKNRSGANVWATYHQSLGNNVKIVLNSSDAQDADGAFMNGTLPTSSVFSVGASANTNTGSSNYVAYCFNDVQGYSKFGKYVGNGSGTSDGSFNGAFVYLGFKPAWVLIKRSSYSAGDGWVLFDNKRGPINYNQNQLNPASDAAESGALYDAVDFLSNGFKARTGRAGVNASGSTYIYMAFAENPFTTSKGIPTTARALTG